MKKLMFGIASAAGLALSAHAAYQTETFHSPQGTSFEALTAGEAFQVGFDDDGGTTGDIFWFTDNTESVGTVTNKADLVEAGIPAYGAEVGLPDDAPATNDKCLVIDTDKRLYRSALGNSAVADGTTNVVAFADLGTDIYFDSMVLFTTTDRTPATESGDKLVVWLYGYEDSESVHGEGTNLVVTAGYGNSGALAPKDYVISGLDIEPNTWHRLTIKTVGNIASTSTSRFPGFLIYVDGEAVTRGEGDAGDVGNLVSVGGELSTDAAALVASGALFPALVSGNDEAGYLTGVAFDGTGAVDDLYFTTTTPAFLVEPVVETFEYTVTWDADEVADFTWSVDGGEAAEGEAGVAFAVPNDVETLTVNVRVVEGYKPTNAAFARVGDIDGDECYTWTITVNVSDLAKDGTDALEIEVEEDGDTPPDPVDEPEFDSGDAEAQAYADAATSATGIKVRNVTATAEMISVGADGVTTITIADGVSVTVPAYYTVTVNAAADGFDLALNDKALADIGDTEENKAIEVSADEIGVTLVATEERLYYGLEVADEPTAAADDWTRTTPVQGTGDALTLTVEKGENDVKGFYRLYVTDIAPATAD